jgi:LemA protein
MTETFVALGIFVVIALMALLATYNALAELRQQVRTAWGDLDRQLKKRYDLLPMLVNLVQSTGSAGVVPISAVIAAKHEAAVAFNPPQLAAAESALDLAIDHVLARSESEPALKSDSRFEAIKQKLLASNADIARSRMQYNDDVAAFNAAAAGFPYSVSAVLFGFVAQPTFDGGSEINLVPAFGRVDPAKRPG